MSLATRALRRLLDLPAPRASRVGVTRDVAVPMPDGAVLRHDHHRPLGGPGRGPVVLVRSPYGRRSLVGVLLGRLVAEHGLAVVVQSVRGTAGSGGVLSPFDEADDGAATVRWLVAQPWCDGRIVTLGPSYLGLVQWALAPHAGPALRAMGTMVTASQFRDQTYAGGAFSLDNALSWTALMQGLARGGAAGRWSIVRREHAVARAARRLPLGGGDVVATGGRVEWYQEWLRESAPDSAYWARRSYAAGVGDVGRAGVEVTMAGGWQDIFLPWQLADHAALRAAGARPRLVVGPWVHAAPAGLAAGLREAFAGFDRALGLAATTGAGAAATSEDHPVVVWLSGSGSGSGSGRAGRRDLVDWPPPSDPTRWYLQPGGALGPEPPPHDRGRGGRRFVYDPADPTPAVGGPILAGPAGVRDQARLEARADVVLFTSAPLPRETVLLGPVGATVWIRASAPHLDVVVRLCDVDPDGRSVNVTDGLLRIDDAPPEDDPQRAPRRVDVELWPVGHRVAAGHRLRVQICGGAHPRFARNPGTGDTLGEATRLVAVAREVSHDAAHPSHITLPVERA